MRYPYPVRVRSARPVLRAAERAPPSGGKVCFGKAFTAIISGWRRDAGHMRRGQPRVKGKCFIKKTVNYQLNQWDPGDRILREEFNRDNEKIDSGLAEVRAALPIVKLTQLITAKDAEQVDIDLSPLDLTQYHRLDLYLTPGPETGAQENIYLRCNGLASGYVAENTNHPFLTYVPVGAMPQYFCHGSLQIYLGRCLMGGSTYGCLDYQSWENGLIHCSNTLRYYGLRLSPSELETLNLTTDSADKKIRAGTEIQLYGVRK